jgi:capsular polysaccharide biosynthesis protein
MELKEYIQIFKRHLKLFVLVTIATVVIGLTVQKVLPTRYKVEVNLDVTRSGQQAETSDYRYDEFYRLQADERFADTVVRWIESGRIQEDIRIATKDVDFKKLKAMRLSSQLIKTTFLVAESDRSKDVTNSISMVLNKKTADLNKDQNNPNWFKVIVSKPVVVEYKIPTIKLVIIMLILGMFIGFWTVFMKHYLED